MSEFKGINYFKNNCEENYITTPISVLRYITELENEREEMLGILEELYSDPETFSNLFSSQQFRIEKLIKKATEL